MKSKCNEIIKLLGLEEHPCEGGFFKRTYTAQESNKFAKWETERPISSAIFYLFGEDALSYPHSLQQDEIWHFYSGDSIELLLIKQNEEPQLIIMGSDILQGEKPQVVITAGTIFCAKLKSGGDYGLIGATLAPAFAYTDYQAVECSALIIKYPQFRDFLNHFRQK